MYFLANVRVGWCQFLSFFGILLLVAGCALFRPAAPTPADAAEKAAVAAAETAAAAQEAERAATAAALAAKKAAVTAAEKATAAKAAAEKAAAEKAAAEKAAAEKAAAEKAAAEKAAAEKAAAEKAAAEKAAAEKAAAEKAAAEATAAKAAGKKSSVNSDAAARDAVAGSRAPRAPLPKEYFQSVMPGQYRLQVGDVVEVGILNNADTVSRDVPIALDGKLYYMFGKGVQAAGRTPAEVAAEIEQSIRTLFNSPVVSIIPQSFSGNRVMVFGMVAFPNIIQLDSALTIRQAVARTGGLAQGLHRGAVVEISSLKDSYLRRGGQLIPVDFDRLFTLNDESQDIFLRPGDVLYIGSGLGKGREVYLIGGNLTDQKAVPYTDGMTLVALLTSGADQTGGYMAAADMERIVILRGPLDKPDVHEVNLKNILTGKSRDVLLESGDIVYVPDKPYKYLREVVKTAVLNFGRAFGGNLGDRAADNVISTSTSSY